MAGNRIICDCNDVDYLTIRKAMCRGARTLEEIKEMTGAMTGDCSSCNKNCTDEISNILLSVCGCRNVSLVDVVQCVKDGATTVDEVAHITGAGADCTRCQALVQNIIDLGY